MAAPWWLTTKYNFDPAQGSSQAYYDATTGRQVYENGGKYYYSLPTEDKFTTGEDGQWVKTAGSAGEAVPTSLLNSQPQSAQVLGGTGVNGMTQIRLADGTVTNATPINGDANDFSKLFEGMVPGEGYSQVRGQGAPQTQLVRGSDGNMYAALPSDAKFSAKRADDSGFGSLLTKDFAPLAMAALPFSGVGSALTSALGGGSLGSAASGAIINAGTSLLTGGDPIAGAVRGGAGALLGPALTNAGVPSAVTPFITNAAISGATGGDVGQSLLNTAINTGVRTVGGLFDSPTQVASAPTQQTDAPVYDAPQSTDTTQPSPTTNAGDTPVTDAELNVLNNLVGAGVASDPNSAAMDYTGSDGWLSPDASPQPYTGSDGWISPDASPQPYTGSDGWLSPEPSTGGGTAAPASGGNTFANFLRLLFGGGAAAGAAGGASGGASGSGGLFSGGSSSLLLPLLGGLLGGMSGGSRPAGTTTTINDIPEWQRPYVTRAFDQAGNALNDANTAYAATRPTTDLATNNLNATIRGDYLNSNPYLDGMFNTAANSVANKVNSTFSSAGRYGSGAQTSTLTEGLGNLANNIYGQNYQQERQRQFAGSLAAPSYSQGTTQAAYGPASGYANIVRQPVGSTQSSPYFTNPLGGAVSGLLGGYALSRA